MIFYFIIEDLFRILRFSFYRIFFILSIFVLGSQLFTNKYGISNLALSGLLPNSAFPTSPEKSFLKNLHQAIWYPVPLGASNTGRKGSGRGFFPPAPAASKYSSASFTNSMMTSTQSTMGKMTLFVTVLICAAADFHVDSIAADTFPAFGAANAFDVNSSVAASQAAASGSLLISFPYLSPQTKKPVHIDRLFPAFMLSFFVDVLVQFFDCLNRLYVFFCKPCFFQPQDFQFHCLQNLYLHEQAVCFIPPPKLPAIAVIASNASWAIHNIRTFFTAHIKKHLFILRVEFHFFQ